MLLNLYAEIKRTGRTQTEVAKFLGITKYSFNMKILGKSPFKSDEMFAIQKEFFPDKTLEYLFEKKSN